MIRNHASLLHLYGSSIVIQSMSSIRKNVFNEIGHENVFISKSKNEDDVSTDQTSKEEVGDMSSTLESDNLESIKNLGSVKVKTTNKIKLESGTKQNTKQKILW